MPRVTAIVVVAVLAAALLGGISAHHRLPTPATPSSAMGAMTHPREGAMYHQPYTSTR